MSWTILVLVLGLGLDWLLDSEERREKRKQNAPRNNLVLGLIVSAVFGALWFFIWLDRNNNYPTTATVVGEDNRFCTYTKGTAFITDRFFSINGLYPKGVRFVACDDESTAKQLIAEGWTRYEKSKTFRVSFQNSVGKTVENSYVLPRDKADQLATGSRIPIRVSEDSVGGTMLYSLYPDATPLRQMPLFTHFTTAAAFLYLLYASTQFARARRHRTNQIKNDELT
jgi:hypothetical protein